MKNPFIQEYRKVYSLFEHHHKYQTPLPEGYLPIVVTPTGALSTDITMLHHIFELAYRQKEAAEEVILAHRRNGRAIVKEWLRLSLEEEAQVFNKVQHMTIESFLIEREARIPSIQSHSLKGLNDALHMSIADLLETFTTFYDDDIKKEKVATRFNIFSISDLIEKYGTGFSRNVLAEVLPQPLDTPAPPPAAAGASAVADLCRTDNGFTLTDLSALLLRLAVIDAAGTCLTNKLRGKAQGKRGAFTAAYRVLHRAGLLNATATDREWAGAFKVEYGADLGDDAIAHQLTAHGQAHDNAPGAFQKAVVTAHAWVSEWKARLKT